MCQVVFLQRAAFVQQRFSARSLSSEAAHTHKPTGFEESCSLVLAETNHPGLERQLGPIDNYWERVAACCIGQPTLQRELLCL